jgi:hypothetical protein
LRLGFVHDQRASVQGARPGGVINAWFPWVEG